MIQMCYLDRNGYIKISRSAPDGTLPENVSAMCDTSFNPQWEFVMVQQPEHDKSRDNLHNTAVQPDSLPSKHGIPKYPCSSGSQTAISRKLRVFTAQKSSA